MQKKTLSVLPEKLDLHPRNLHRNRYDFKSLIKSFPDLEKFVKLSPRGEQTINFADPLSVKSLNNALLKHFYNIDFWDIPENYLCPPIPGRADYIHYAADLLGSLNHGVIPTGSKINILDIGTGANLIYPILGHMVYNWNFVGSEIDPIALRSARKIIENNPSLKEIIECRLQLSSKKIFKNIFKKDELFDLTVCNPPFHSSPEEALAGTQRKWHNLGYGKELSSKLNFGGQNKELWCEGGEVEFINQMISESKQLAKQCLWFTTLVSKSERLPAIYKSLKKISVCDFRIIEMAQGQKISRILAWTFLDKEEQEEWKVNRW